MGIDYWTSGLRGYNKKYYKMRWLPTSIAASSELEKAVAIGQVDTKFSSLEFAIDVH